MQKDDWMLKAGGNFGMETRQHDTKISYDENTHLIEQSSYRYSLQERATPNLYRRLYDYESVPKVSFNHRFVPVNMPKDIWITDTTFRDGQQAQSPFTVRQITDLFTLLHRLGGPNGILRLLEEGPGGSRCVPGPRLRVPGDHHVDPRRLEGFPAREVPRRAGDRSAGFLLGLPYL